jgi:ribosomal protein S18 acetylase RimI-like enzyme
VHLRHVKDSDYEKALALTDSLWDGRPRDARLSRVFFVQFAQVSFAFEADGDLVGLLLGLLSQTRPDEAVVHFVGVDPAFRRLGFGRRLYERFFAAAQMHGRKAVRAYAVPADREAIAFHLALGFEPLGEGALAKDTPVCPDYTGKGGHRVVLRRSVGPELEALSTSLTRAG